MDPAYLLSMTEWSWGNAHGGLDSDKASLKLVVKWGVKEYELDV